MIDVNDLRKGVTFTLDGELYRVLEYQHYKPGRGNAVIRTKLRNIRSGKTLDKTFVSGDRVQDIRLDHRMVQYMYSDGSLDYFMDIELPIAVDLEVIDAPPGFAGDTAANATKEVTLQTGMKLYVPLFINQGDIVRVDTRDGRYLTRV